MKLKIVSFTIHLNCESILFFLVSGASYWHDAVANQIVNTADIRADFEHMYYEYHLSKNQLFPDNATDFYGKCSARKDKTNKTITRKQLAI